MSKRGRRIRIPPWVRIWRVVVGLLLLIFAADLVHEEGIERRLGIKSAFLGLPLAVFLIYSGLRR